MRIMSMLRNLFHPRTPTAADAAFDFAMSESDSLIAKMRECSDDTKNPIRAIMADIWAQNHNIPYLVTVYESVQEMNVVKEYKPLSGADSERKKH